MRVLRFGESEVEHLDVAVGSHDSVRRFEVAVHDTVLMNERDHVEELDRDVHGFGPRQARFQSTAKAPAIDQLEHEKVVVLPCNLVINRADVGMIELREDPCLVQESGLRVGPQTVLGSNRFQGDPALEGVVKAPVDVCWCINTKSHSI